MFFILICCSLTSLKSSVAKQIFWFYFSENLFKIDENRIYALEAEEKRLNEEIARREKERESEPVSK